MSINVVEQKLQHFSRQVSVNDSHNLKKAENMPNDEQLFVRSEWQPISASADKIIGF